MSRTERKKRARATSNKMSDHFKVTKKRNGHGCAVAIKPPKMKALAAGSSTCRLPALAETTGRKRMCLRSSLHPTPLGNFDACFSPELLFHFFDTISLIAVGKLATTSKAFRQRIDAYVSSSAASQRFARETKLIWRFFYCSGCANVHTDFIAPKAYRQWGYLLKVITCLENTEKRIKRIQDFFDKHCQQNLAVSSGHLSGWGQLFMAVTKYWEQSELERVFVAIMHFKNRHAWVERQKFLNGIHGQDTLLEYKVRIFFRKMFLDDSHDTEFWFERIIRNLSVQNRGKFLALLFGPVRHKLNGTFRIEWRNLCDFEVASLDDAKKRLSGYATALKTLLATPLTSVDMFMLIEELTTFPEPWALDNFAALLLLVPKVAIIVLEKRVRCADPGMMNEAINIFVAMQNLAARWGTFDNVLTELLIQLIKIFPRQCFVKNLLGQIWLTSLINNSELVLQPVQQQVLNNNFADILKEKRGFHLTDHCLRKSGHDFRSYA